MVIAAAVYALVLPLGVFAHSDQTAKLAGIRWAITALFAADLVVHRFRARESERASRAGTGWTAGRADGWAWFPVDLLACLPLSVTTLQLTPGAFGLIKLARVGHLMHAARQRLPSFAGALLLGFTAFWLLLAVHWICSGWLLLRGPEPSETLLSNYIDSLYWTITTLTTVGYGDVTPVTDAQKVYAIATMVAGIAFIGYLIGIMASILSKRDPARARFLENVEALSVAAKYGGIPRGLQTRIYDYYTYVWRQRRGYDESEFLESLPRSLEEEVSLYMKRDVVSRVGLFRGADPAFLRYVALRLKPQVLTPGDWVFREGDEGTEMYFIVRGEVEVSRADHPGVRATLGEGDFFGEIALFAEPTRTASVRAITYCDVYALSKSAFQAVLQRFPESMREIERKAVSRRRQDMAPRGPTPEE